jgi:hypothetical protein
MTMLKRLLLSLAAVFCLSGAALAQTTLPPYITGTQEQGKDSIDFIGIQRISQVTGLVATPSGTLANSAVLNRGMNIVATVTTTNDSFTLPTLTGSVMIAVINGGANTLRVFPNVSTGQIDTGGAGTSQTIAANKMRMFWQGAPGLWYIFVSP